MKIDGLTLFYLSMSILLLASAVMALPLFLNKSSR